MDCDYEPVFVPTDVEHVELPLAYGYVIDAAEGPLEFR